MAKRISPEAALLMLHWQNSVCDPKGVWGKNLCRQIEKNNAIRNAQSVLATARNRGMLTIFVNIGWRPGFPELPGSCYMRQHWSRRYDVREPRPRPRCDTHVEREAHTPAVR